MIVDLEERLVGDVVFAEVEGLLKAKFFVEGCGCSQVVDTDGDVGDAVEGWGRSAIGLREREGGEKCGEKRGEQPMYAGFVDARL
jgi:hypothetical protein